MLVVDDDVGVREALHLVLEEEYEVADAADGGAAVNAVRARPVDLVLLDILLPGVDGIETLKELKAVAPEIPVIMLTGVKTIRTSVAAMKLGALDYITKPFQEEELLGLIRGAIVSSPPRARRILVVDSDPGRRATLAVLLARFAAVVATAESPNDLDRVGRALSLCVVLGLGHGRAAIMQTVRSVHARFPACPIVAVLESHDRDITQELEALKVCEILRPAEEVTNVVHRVGSILSAGARPQHTPVRFSGSVTQAVKYVSAKHAEKLSVEVIAAAVDTSSSHLAHGFRLETGMAVMAFVTSVRVEIGKHLLTTTERSLAQIATESGFFDASHLSRTFLLTTGRRPGFYRQPPR